MNTMMYASALGDILLAADEKGLTGLWFVGQKYYADGLKEPQEKETAILREATRWLDQYFAGQEPDFTPPLHPQGTPFQKEVWQLLCEIPYGQRTTYGALAARLAERRGMTHFSAQAVGGAVGRNPVSIIIPCHRVVGSSGSLTGYAGGLERKTRLLALEGVDESGLFIPKKGTAL